MRTAFSVPVVTIGLLTTLLESASAQDADGWHNLFDGQSLAGWRANENPNSFSVQDGKIVVKGPRSHLFYVGEVAGAQFENFILELEVMTKPKANSGVFFHTRFQETGWPAHGYEVQVNSTHGDSIKTGSLYGVVKVNPAPSLDDQWFRLRCEVRGRRVTTSVDGTVVVEYLEPGNIEGTRRLSRGTIALQAHDPGSEVHYRSIRVKVLEPGVEMSRADWVSGRQGAWFEQMDYGPFLSSVVEVNRKDTVLKGITVELNPERSASVLFDTDLLRMVAGWAGHLELRGTPYDGRHGTQPSMAGAPLFHVAPGGNAGVTVREDWSDGREIAFGPIPDERGRFRGLYRHGEQVVFEYEVGDRIIREVASWEKIAGVPAITRSFEVQPGKQSLRIALADEPKREVSLSESGTFARSSSGWNERTVDDTDDRVILVDRTLRGFDELAMGGPRADDDVDVSKRPELAFRFVEKFAPPHVNAGADGDKLPRINDGDFARNRDDTARNTWLDGPQARVTLDLGSPELIHRINTYSWHHHDRAPQVYTLWGTTKEKPNVGGKNLQRQGWEKIATIDSRELGYGEKHGSTVSDRKDGIGPYRHLLWDLTPLNGRYGLFISEIDVFLAGSELPKLKPPIATGDRRSLTLVATKAEGFELGAKDGRVFAAVAPSDGVCRFAVAATRELDDGSTSWSTAQPTMVDIAPLCAGGPSLWPNEIEVQGKLSKAKDPYVVDDIPIPLENPWKCSMRVGGFDFFEDGDRAAICTWNGDVWIVSGLAGDWSTLTWRRFAGGLFETLGLCIVDGVIHVNGRDQITRLYDLNGDGEADFYECFNNDVITTKNFHEFTFDLQTDAEGNFYFSKGGPVRAGGRGFETIVPHHGTVLKLAPDGSKLEVFATGMRAPNGIGVSPTGQVTAGDNEGTWVPHCKLHWLKPGSFQGVVDLAHRAEKPTDYNPPLCWFPMEVDNSGGSQVWVTSDRWGPMTGDLLHLSYGQSSIYRVLWEEREGVAQGGVVRVPVNLGSSAMRARFHPKDGQLYVCGLRGWQTNAARLAAFQRVRYTGSEFALPRSLKAFEQGLALEFEVPMDRELAEDIESYSVEMWNYVWGPQYGSPEVSVLEPDEEVLEQALKTEMKKYRKRDELSVSAAKLSEDGRTVFLTIDQISPVMQMKVTADLETADGEVVQFELHNTIHWLGATPPR